MLLTLISLLFPLGMLTAAFTDLTRFKIPNWLVAALLVAWLAAVLFGRVSLVDAALLGLTGGLLLIAGIMLFAAGVIGGGDAKLLAVQSMWIGPSLLAPFLFATAIAGAVFGIGLLIVRRLPLPVAEGGWVDGLMSRKKDMPYGVALAVGGLIVWPETVFFPF